MAYFQGKSAGSVLQINGGYSAKPTSAKYNVQKGKTYSIFLPEVDANDSATCVFDNVIQLGESSICRSVGSPMQFNALNEIQDFVQYVNSDSGDPIPLEPPDGKRGTGIGGVGVCGQAKFVSFQPGIQLTVLEIISIKKSAGKGGTGFLEITYPSQIEKLNIFDDIYT
jgi:hypothetical protein